MWDEMQIFARNYTDQLRSFLKPKVRLLIVTYELDGDHQVEAAGDGWHGEPDVDLGAPLEAPEIHQPLR